MRLAKLCLLAAAIAPVILAAAPTAAAAKPGREEIRRIIVEEASRTSVPPSLALAVAAIESNFDPRAESHKGARGVMQIMPKTAWDIYRVTADELWNPRLNVQLGIDFLDRLAKRYGGRWDLALSHYNGGSKVGDPPNARVIPYTRKYVDNVLVAQRRFAREATVLALARTAPAPAPVPAPPPATAPRGERTPYWLFDAPAVDRNWREYLKAADYWLDRGRRSELPDAASEEPPPAAPAVAAHEPAGDAWAPPPTPSERLAAAQQDLRRRFRDRLDAGDLPWRGARWSSVAGS